ncbi:guanine deaminase [Corynebacterium heidelbergense]|uniref:Guanine deaminase n=1 Tax=Corynebacterium heidelbergense TaxID=2055947 RepID=A0A364V3T8_9CORY|nr:guanine deaminase [Corynebacterium heidelbergense]RAV31297.1 guanine deaminase [Corynebacterium heidelbergense]
MFSAIRGHVVTPTGEGKVAEFPDGLIVYDATIRALGEYSQIAPQFPDLDIDDCRGQLILPGFVDCHVHYPQLRMTASPGHELLGWLENYTFPAEMAFADAEHCQEVAEEFCAQLTANGVSTAAVYATVHPQSVDALFTAAEKVGQRVLCGKVCMDRHAPEALLDTAGLAYEQSGELIERWHGRGRLEYAITPRFAPTSSPEQLDLLGRLAQEFPDVAIQTHLSENVAEVEWVAELFPLPDGARNLGDVHDYTGVYERAGLVRRRSIFGHGLYLSDSELSRLGRAGAGIAHCPTSNAFLGSGQFGYRRAAAVPGLEVGLGSDIGAGTSLSPLQTMGGAYAASRLSGAAVDAFELLHAATLGGARALGVAEHTGSLEAGKEADIAVVDPQAGGALLRSRVRHADSLEEVLFALWILGDERVISRTVTAGRG